ncbi:GH-E family nuclease [Flavobacterium sp. ENC]|uniref:GH-E family nuclease n=1 Tax=Flavobacterium sp. ENC TaxID=2897330 RepID=UPI001E396427|nr:GH-E family nuclease [Flavobacterium sp. ENC]MCD0465046.1 HNH/ENDO VII family nuclease [Flavobacterium sp. ENC]
MERYQGKISDNKTVTTAANVNRSSAAVQLKDNRELSLVQRRLQEPADYTTDANQTVQLQGKISGTVIQLGKKNKKDDSSEDEYVPPQGKKQKRFTIPRQTVEKVIKKTAHKRVHHNSKYRDVYSCPACTRPLASTTKGKINLDLTRFDYTSKGGNKHSQRALALDHFPPWAERERALKARGASHEEMKEDHNDPSRLRALCKKCNESHKFESKKKLDYKSEDDEEGYVTDDGEHENKGNYKDFRKDPPPDPGSGSAGITA